MGASHLPCLDTLPVALLYLVRSTYLVGIILDDMGRLASFPIKKKGQGASSFSHVHEGITFFYRRLYGHGRE